MLFPEASAAQMTLLFLMIVGALGAALIWLISALETSPALSRVRRAFVAYGDIHHWHLPKR